MQLVTRLLSRMLIVGGVMVTIALFATLMIARQDIRDEIDSSKYIGQLLSVLEGVSHETPIDRQINSIDQLNAGGGLRNFHIALFNAEGQRLTSEPIASPETITTHISRWLLGGERVVPYRLPVPWADGHSLMIVLEPQPQYESTEAITSALLQFALFGAITAALIIALWISVRRALSPISKILEGIARIEAGDYASPIQTHGIRELDQIAHALNHLARALTLEHAKQHELLHRLQDVQEDERRRLAHELHDEFGQLLTAVQVDASYLLKQTSGQPALEECARAVVENSGSILMQLRSLLSQLRPYGLQGNEDRQIALEPALRELVRQRQQRNDNALDCRLSVVLEAAQLPQRLAVAVYRITQEALTNVMRHANATQVDITVRADSQPGTLSLSIIDNGLGLTHQDVSNNLTAPNLQGIGLAGIRERVMANQGVLTLEAAQPQGLAIRVIFPFHAAAEDRLRTQARDLSHSAANPALS
ncbi:MAG: histidine kinase [Burkholderiaceae bacterium]